MFSLSATTVGWLLVPLMFLFLFMGISVVWSVALSALIGCLLWSDMSTAVIFQQFYTGIDNYSLLAIPLFILCGELMMRLRIIDDILAFCDIIIGKLHGGLGYVNVLANVFFAAISGSAVADMAAVGTVLTPKMKEQGYRPEFSLSLTAAASVIGPIIPPSILMVIYCSMMTQSVGAMFISGVVPGVMLGLALMGYVYYIAKKEKLPRSENVYTPKKVVKITLRSIPAMLTPVVILGGIFSGMFSPTEAAGMVCMYALLLGLLYYRNLTFNVFIQALSAAMISASGIMLIVAIAHPFSYLLTMSGFPRSLQMFVSALTTNKYLLLLAINIICLILGCLMESTANCLIFAPIFAPIAISAGVDPLHFGLIFILNLIMGVATPPFGVCLFMGANIGKIKVEKLMKAVLPMIGLEIIVLLLCTYVPDVVLFLPRLFGVYSG